MDVRGQGAQRGTRARRGAALIGAALLALLGTSAVSSAGVASAYTVYVTNESGSSVTPIDTATNAAAPAIKVGSAPERPAVTPDGKTLYVPDSEGVVPVSTSTGAPGAQIKLVSSGRAVAISPDGRTAWVAVNSGVIPVNVATNAAGAEIKTSATPEAIAITPDGSTLYVANTEETVTPIPIATGAPGAAIKVGKEPKALAITPNGKTVYVVNGAPSNSVTPIDTATNTPGEAIAVGGRPFSIAISPDGATAYTADDSGGTVTPVNLVTDTAGSAIKLGECLDAIGITPDGKTVYVADACKGTVFPIDTASGKVGAPIPVGSNPEGLTIAPDASPVAVLSASAATLGRPTALSAASSSDADGSIASYAWDFGDGSSLTTATPGVTHTYAAAGTYTARVTLTDNAGCTTSFVFTGQTALCAGSGVASATASAVVAAVPAAVAPAITGLAQSHSRWRGGNRLASASRRRRAPLGTSFSYTLNEAASVRLVFTQSAAGRKVKGRCVAPSRSNRRRRACRRTVSKGALEFAAHAGMNKIAFQGRLSTSKKLTPGGYTVTFVATDAGGRSSASKSLRFTIVG